MPKATVVITTPFWEDLEINGKRFKYALQYMNWIIDSINDYAKSKGYDVRYLKANDCTRENLTNVVNTFKPSCHIHGGHGGCNLLVERPGSPPKALIGSPSRGYCDTSEPLCTGSGAADVPDPNPEVSKDQIGIDIACLSGRWLAEDRVNAGAKAVIAYDNLLYFAAAREDTYLYYDDVQKECYSAAAIAILDGKTVREALDYGKSVYQFWIDKLNKEKPPGYNILVTILTRDRDVLIAKGNLDAKITVPEIVTPPPAEANVYMVVLTGGKQITVDEIGKYQRLIVVKTTNKCYRSDAWADGLVRDGKIPFIISEWDDKEKEFAETSGLTNPDWNKTAESFKDEILGETTPPEPPPIGETEFPKVVMPKPPPWWAGIAYVLYWLMEALFRFGEFYNKTADAFKSAFSSVKKHISFSIRDIPEKLKSTIKSEVKPLSDGIVSLNTGLKEVLKDITDLEASINTGVNTLKNTIDKGFVDTRMEFSNLLIKNLKSLQDSLSANIFDGANLAADKTIKLLDPALVPLVQAVDKHKATVESIKDSIDKGLTPIFKAQTDNMSNINKTLSTIPEKGVDSWLSALGAEKVTASPQQWVYKPKREKGKGIIEQIVAGAFSQLMLQRPEVAKITIDETRVEIAAGTIREDLLVTDEAKQILKTIKQSLIGSPESISDLLQTIFIEPWHAILKWLLNLIAPIEKPSYEASVRHASRYIAFVGDIIILVGIIDTIIEFITLGQIEGIGRTMMNLIWGIGLGGAVQYAIGPALERSVTRQIEYHFNKQYLQEIPTKDELITMVVREAFLPERVIPAPDEFVEWMALRGFSKEWCDRYWTAHFLPMPLERAYDAYYRGVIDENEFRKRLLWADYHPLDHDTLVKIAWQPLSRYEARWGWETGVVDDTKLYTNFRWMGLSPEDAKTAVEATKAYVLRAEREDIIRGTRHDFEYGWIDEEQLRANLKALGLHDRIIDVYVEASKIERERKIKEEWVDIYIKAFLENRIDETKLRQNLIALGMVNERIEAEVAYAKEKKKISVEVAPTLTSTQILRLYQLGKRDREWAYRKLKEKNYSDEDAEALLDLYTPKS